MPQKTELKPKIFPSIPPFVKLKAGATDPGKVESWDGWAVERSGDDAKDYATGKSYAEIALANAVKSGDVGPVTFTLAAIYRNAYKLGLGNGAMERGFIDRVTQLACASFALTMN